MSPVHTFTEQINTPNSSSKSEGVKSEGNILETGL